MRGILQRKQRRTLWTLSAMCAALAIAPAALGGPGAGTIEGKVAEVHQGGRYFMLDVGAASPDGLATVGEPVKVMANWGPKPGGGVGPKPDDVQRIQALARDQRVAVVVRRDDKHDGYRFTTEEKARQINQRARLVAETMVMPTSPERVDPSRVTGADLARLAELERAIEYTIDVPAGGDVAAALRKAKSHIERDQAVRLRIAEGRFPVESSRNIAFSGGSAGSPLLVIEGAGKDKTILDFADASGTKELIYVNKKHNLVLRGFSMVNHRHSPLVIGKYWPTQDNGQVLIEDAAFDHNHIGMTIFHVDGITVRDVRASHNGRTGLFLIATNAIIEDSVFTHNLGDGPGSFIGGIALAAEDAIIRRVRCDDNPNKSSGLRMDHAGRNVLIEDSTFNRNGRGGHVWETALGPIEARRSEFIGNGESGLHLATVYHFAVDDCVVRDNGEAQFLIVAKPRPVIAEARGNKAGAYGAADLTVPPGEHWTNLKGMTGNRFLSVTNTLIATDDPSAPFFAHEYGKPSLYHELFTNMYEASSNTYVSPSTDVLFDDFRGAYQEFSLIGLDAWKVWTGVEQGSVYLTSLP